MSHEAHLLHTPLIVDDAPSALFNSEVMSDLIVVFPRSGNKLFLHRFIVCDENDFFSACMTSGMRECEEGTIVMDHDDDEELMTILLRSCYDTHVQAVEHNRLLPLMKLAHKYQFYLVMNKLASLIRNNLDLLFQCLDFVNEDMVEMKQFNCTMATLFNASWESIMDHELHLLMEFEHLKKAMHLMIDEYKRFVFVDPLVDWLHFDISERGQHAVDLMTMIKSTSTVRLDSQ